MKIKEIYDIYRNNKQYIPYLAFVKILKGYIDMPQKFSEYNLNQAEIDRICDGVMMDRINLSLPEPEIIEPIPEPEIQPEEPININEDPKYVDEVNYIDEDVNEIVPWITANYDELLAKSMELKDIIILMHRLDKLDDDRALKMVDRLMKSPRRVKKIVISDEYKNNPTFMTVLLKDYTYAFLPRIWRRGGKNHNIYENKIVKIFKWDYFHVVVFNDTEILHIY